MKSLSNSLNSPRSLKYELVAHDYDYSKLNHFSSRFLFIGVTIDLFVKYSVYYINYYNFFFNVIILSFQYKWDLLWMHL